MKKLQIDNNSTKQVRIDAGWHKLLAYLKADLEKPMKDLIEDALVNTYGIDNKSGKPYVIKNLKK